MFCSCDIFLWSCHKCLLLARLISNISIKDRIESKTMFENLGWLSFNQMNAQIKLLEAWKMMNIPNYPNKLERMTTEPNGRSTRAVTNGKVLESGKSKLGLATFISDSVRAWNKSHNALKDITSIYIAKKEIKKIAIALPFYLPKHLNCIFY